MNSASHDVDHDTTTDSAVRGSAFWVELHWTLHKQVNSSWCGSGGAASGFFWLSPDAGLYWGWVTAGHSFGFRKKVAASVTTGQASKAHCKQAGFSMSLMKSVFMWIFLKHLSLYWSDLTTINSLKKYCLAVPKVSWSFQNNSLHKCKWYFYVTSC